MRLCRFICKLSFAAADLLFTYAIVGGGCSSGECTAPSGGAQQQRQHGQQPVRRQLTHALQPRCYGHVSQRVQLVT
jgi:hypothetical protein